MKQKHGVSLLFSREERHTSLSFLEGGGNKIHTVCIRSRTHLFWLKGRTSVAGARSERRANPYRLIPEDQEKSKLGRTKFPGSPQAPRLH